MTEPNNQSQWSLSPFSNITDYQLTPLKYACDFLSRGITPNYPEHDEGYWVLNQSCVRLGNIDYLQRKYHVPEKEIVDNYVLETGDVLLNSTGTGTAGRSAVFKDLQEIDTVFADSHITILRPNQSVLLPKYLGYVLRSEVMMDYFDEVLSVGATNQIELNQGDVSDLRVPTPPIEEQKLIIERLDAVNIRIERLISQSKRLIELLNEKRNVDVTNQVLGKGVK